MQPVDIERFVAVGRPSISPDGSFVLYATSRPDIAANRAVGQVWRIDLPDGAPRRITRGVADARPELSPDGSSVAFLRGDAKRRPQLFVAPADGGEAVQVTDAPLGVGAFDWSADGATIAYLAMVPEAGRYGTVDGLDPSAESPRRVTGVTWHANGLGYTIDRPWHVFVVPAPDPGSEPSYEPAPTPRSDAAEPPSAQLIPVEPRAVTEGATSHQFVAFSVDGTEIYTVEDEVQPDRSDLRSRLIAVAVDGSGEREVIGRAANLWIGDLVVAEDGAVGLLAADVGPDGVDFVAPPVAVWMLSDGEPRRLTDPDVVELSDASVHLTAVGQDFLVQRSDRGRVGLLRVGRDGSTTEVLGGDVEVSGHAAAGERIVAAVSSPTSFGELVLVDAEGSRVLTAHGAAVSEVPIVTPVETTVTGRDGTEIHGWVAVPPGEGPHPVILQIHGGPYAHYGVHLFDETQVLAAAGYAVAYCNPRGSASYGRAHGRSIRGRMGTDDFDDVIDFLDGVVAADSRLDGNRVGVMGGSYGGFLTAWIIAHDHRFAGAIVERGFLDPASFVGTSDIGRFFVDEYVGVDPADIARQSPMAVVAQVTTPTLVLHSEADYRCPLEQATRYYTALRRQGTPAEMLVFPGEDHELTRGGQPRHRVERFDAVLDWWRRHLPVS